MPAILHPVRGKREVLDLIARNLGAWWREFQWIAADMNGGRGVVLREGGLTVAAVSFAYDAAGRATNIYIVRNPDKLRHLRAV